MPTHTAHARGVKTGKGEIDFANGLFRSAYTFGSRFETRSGTNPPANYWASHTRAVSPFHGRLDFPDRPTSRARGYPAAH